MTCREKLALEHPAISAETNCPHDFKYAEPPEYCPYSYKPSGILTHSDKDKLCTSCWDREIPEEKQKSGETKIINDLDKVSHRIGKVHEILKDYGLRPENITEIILKLLPLIITDSGDISAVIKLFN